MKPSRLSPLDLLHLGTIGLRTRKTRAALSALGIALGIATMVVVTGIPASSQRALLDELTALGTNMLRAQPSPRQEDPVLLPEGSAAMAARIGPVTASAAVMPAHRSGFPEGLKDETRARSPERQTPARATKQRGQAVR